MFLPVKAHTILLFKIDNYKQINVYKFRPGLKMCKWVSEYKARMRGKGFLGRSSGNMYDEQSARSAGALAASLAEWGSRARIKKTTLD